MSAWVMRLKSSRWPMTGCERPSSARAVEKRRREEALSASSRPMSISLRMTSFSFSYSSSGKVGRNTISVRDLRNVCALSDGPSM